MAAQASGAPLSPIEYVSAVLGATSSAQLNNTTYTLDNSEGVWDASQANGSGLIVVKDPSTMTIYFVHANYVGERQSSTLEDLALPSNAFAYAALAIPAAAAPAWEIILAGAATIAAAVALVVVSGGVLAPAAIVIGATIMGVIGAATIAAGIYYGEITPTVVGNTCNSTSTSCCITTTSPGGGNQLCTDCTSGACVATSSQYRAPSEGLGATLTAIGVGVAVIAAAGVGGYAAYKYVREHRLAKPAPTYYQPPQPARPS
ncbi:MAG: hypothetical protein ACREB9_00290 [Thermoplasmata archaeon]